MLSYDLSKRGNESRYVFLYRCLRDDILSGELSAGERLPSKRRFAEHLGVGLVTVESAYAQLVAEGYVEARERRGYYVAALPQASWRGSGAGAAAYGRADVCGEAAPASNGSVRSTVLETPGPVLTSRTSEQVARLWSHALRMTLTQEPTQELFGPVPWNGCFRLRQDIARYLEGIRGFAVDPACVVVGAGAQVLYNFVVQLLGRDAIYAVEDPGYPRLTSIYQTNSCDLRFVPLDEAGVSIAALRQSGASVVHLMPSHQFPTGRVTTIARRYELLSWANQVPNRYLVEDDYDCEFRLAGQPIPALASMDAEGRVIYLGTFSKSLSSALRIAYAVLPPALMCEAQHKLAFYSTTVSALDQVTLARLLENGDYERHVNRRRTHIREVRDALLQPLGHGIATGRFRVEEKDSGLHFVLGVRTSECSGAEPFAGGTAGEGADLGEWEQRLARRMEQAGVPLASLSSFCHDAASLPHDGYTRFVVQYDGLDEEAARKSGETIARVLG